MKEIVFLQDMSEFTTYSFKPQLKILGQKYGKRIGSIRQALQALDGSAAKKELDTAGALHLSLPDGDISLSPEELLVETSQKEGYTSVSERGLTVVLDTALTEELIEEGFVREIISKLQSMRKDAGFQVTDHIRVYHQGSGKVEAVLQKHQSEIMASVLGESCTCGALGGYTAEWDVNGEQTSFGVEKV